MKKSIVKWSIVTWSLVTWGLSATAIPSAAPGGAGADVTAVSTAPVALSSASS